MNAKPRKPPPRLCEALEHIAAYGNLMPMQDVTVSQLDRLWNYIDGNGLAIMLDTGIWQLTKTGRAAAAMTREMPNQVPDPATKQ